MEFPEKIRVSAMCLFQKDGKVLVTKGIDTVKNEKFYRVPGGGVDFQETAEEGVRREIKEELDSEIENLELIDVLENIYMFSGRRCHEIIFLYSGVLVNEELYTKHPILITEPDHELEAVWVPMEEIISGPTPLYPTYDYRKLFKP